MRLQAACPIHLKRDIDRGAGQTELGGCILYLPQRNTAKYETCHHVYEGEIQVDEIVV